MGHVNTNSIRNKFDYLVYTPDKSVNIFLISEMKLDDSSPSANLNKKVTPLHAPIKKKYVGANEALFMSKEFYHHEEIKIKKYFTETLNRY